MLLKWVWAKRWKEVWRFLQGSPFPRSQKVTAVDLLISSNPQHAVTQVRLDPIWQRNWSKLDRTFPSWELTKCLYEFQVCNGQSTVFPWKAQTSEKPRRSLLLMSKTPPTEAVSTPPVPRFCSLSFLRISSNLLSWLTLGSLTCTPALSPVPRLLGQVST